MDDICHCGKDEGIVADGAYFDIQGYYVSSWCCLRMRWTRIRIHLFHRDCLFVCLLVVWRDLDGESTFKILTSTHFRCKMEAMAVQSGVKGSDYYRIYYYHISFCCIVLIGNEANHNIIIISLNRVTRSVERWRRSWLDWKLRRTRHQLRYHFPRRIYCTRQTLRHLLQLLQHKF